MIATEKASENFFGIVFMGIIGLAIGEGHSIKKYVRFYANLVYCSILLEMVPGTGTHSKYQY
jgi:hypothetical protein